MRARWKWSEDARGRLHAGAIALAVAVAALHVQPALADMLDVILDQAQVLKLPERAATIVIGNPLIADVSLQAGNLMVVTGKGYGATNILALDRSGSTLMNTTVQVTAPRDNVVVVYRGIDRESYSCTPTCERRITLGDAAPFFDATLGQAGTRSQAAAAGAPAQPSK